MAGIGIHDPRQSSYGRDYWLHRCEGFTVLRAGRELGKVTGLRFGASTEPELLEVRTGRFGKRLLIPVAQVQQIDPKTRRIVLGVPPVATPLDDPQADDAPGVVAV
jgi:ribosomal 30S subunit maturation factor RimM